MKYFGKVNGMQRIIAVLMIVVSGYLGFSIYSQKAIDRNRHKDIWDTYWNGKVPFWLSENRYFKWFDTILTFLQPPHDTLYMIIFDACETDAPGIMQHNYFWNSRFDTIYPFTVDKNMWRESINPALIESISRWDTAYIRKNWKFPESAIPTYPEYAFRLIQDGDLVSIDSIEVSDIFSLPEKPDSDYNPSYEILIVN